MIFLDKVRKRAVIIRSGGLGDFILTLPFILRLAALYQQVTLITKREYWDLVKEDILAGSFFDIDSGAFTTLFGAPSRDIGDVFTDAHVFSFLHDHEGIIDRAITAAGARVCIQLESRPCKSPHVTKRMFDAAGLEIEESSLTIPCLDRGRMRGKKLWLHPGSGSMKKNAPLSLFVEKAEKWVRDGGDAVIISLGEADLDMKKSLLKHFGEIPVEWVIQPPLKALREKLAADAAYFVGNDSGVTHLASVLGIPLTVFFQSTDPAVWAPLGSHVHIINLRKNDGVTARYGIL